MSEMISVASGFQYSVNIGYDLNHEDKLQNFIPTKSSLSLLQDILLSTEDNSTERARVLVGAYGKGKSHIVLTILSMLIGTKWETFTKLKNKVKENPELSQLIENFYESKKVFLPVIISGSSSSMSQSFLLALQKALTENDLSDVMPETNYQAAINSIKKWEKEYPETYKKLRKEIGRPVETLLLDLEEYDVEAYEDFVKVYPKLTSGSVFNPFIGFDVIELYESVVKHIRPRGYAGIYVVYDEFSKFLEANIKEASVSDTKMLQDFAEKCNRSGSEQLHLMLISHKEIANYIDTLPKQKVDGWKGVSDRFKHIHLNNNFTQTYEIISSVIKKSQSNGWGSFTKQYKKTFEMLISRYAPHAIFSDSDMSIVEKTIYGCYPLHPITTFILPRLSERVAQNERTLFTFLSAKGISTLPTFLDSYKDDCFKVVTPDMMFDYFEPLFRKEAYTSELHRNYMLTKSILEKLNVKSSAADASNTCALEIKIVKTIALIYILEQFDKLKPTANEIVGIYSLEYEQEEIRAAIDNLIHNEYVIYLKLSNDFLRLKQSSDVDVKQEIADTIEKNKVSFSVKGTLNSASIDNYMYPSRYNDDREMIRYFPFIFINGEEVTKDVDWDIKSESIEGDGIIYGIIPDTEDSIPRIKELLMNTSRGKERYIFVVPNRYTEIRNIVLKFNAVTKLRDAAEGNELLFDEYEVIYEDLRDVISEYIAQYTHPENYKAVYIHNGEEKNITRKAGLTGLMSDICDRIYYRTPIINNEAINKTKITGIALNSRTKIIAGLLRNILEPGLGLTGTGQEVSIMRSTLIRKNILTDHDGEIGISLKTGDADMDHMLEVISGFIMGAGDTGERSFKLLYNDLTSPEHNIGMRKALIPIYLAVVLHEYRKKVVIVSSNTGEVPLTADTLVQIEANPSMFKVRYLEWDPQKEGLVRELESIFGKYINESEKAANSYDYVAMAMRRWYLSLPKYSKEKIPLRKAKKYKALIRLLKQNIGSYELLFERLPAEFSENGDVGSVSVTINLAKEYYDTALDKLVDTLIQDIKGIFAGRDAETLHERSSLTSVIKDWCESLDSSVFDQLFENGAERCLRLLRESDNDEKGFVGKLAKTVTDLRIEDWNDRTAEQFIERLKEYKKTAEEFSGEAGAESFAETNSYALTYIDDTGNTVTKRFDKVEQSRRGKLLMNALLADIDSMGHAISEQEKRQILMEVLKKMC